MCQAETLAVNIPSPAGSGGDLGAALSGSCDFLLLP